MAPPSSVAIYDSSMDWKAKIRKSLLTAGSALVIFYAVGRSQASAIRAALVMGVVDTAAEYIWPKLRKMIESKDSTSVFGANALSGKVWVRWIAEAGISTSLYMLATMIGVAPRIGSALQTALMVAIADVVGSGIDSMIKEMGIMK